MLTRHPWTLATLSTTLLLLAIGCNSAPPGDGWTIPEPDGGAYRNDGGSVLDGGGATDGGEGTDGGGTPDGSAAPTCDTGGLSGRACAPDGVTSVSNALVMIDTLDCHGQRVHFETRAGSDGHWMLDGLPANDVDVTITVGSFVLTNTARVLVGATTPLDSSKTCFRPDAVKMAVVTGSGDQIETLLGQLGFRPDTFDGKPPSAGGAPPAAAFLTDLFRLQQYQVLFLDCAAFTSHGTLDLGANASTILSNLRAFVSGGGSIYASDWGGVVLALAYPQQIALRLATGGDTIQTTIRSPFDTNRLIGYAPQNVSGTVQNTDLSSYLGHGTVAVTFPTSPPTNHWALLSGARSGVLTDIVGDTYACNGSDCGTRGTLQRSLPLAITYRPNPSRARGGNVIFTSFHNISQSTDDVKRILQYLVFRL